ncbi:hypothetical protein AK812_SmicGene44585 [Symbiodinium microadriaticum]|uniref:Uncharacterized protein n=1 Tax=Symbiodinium microadriaticum TaxID=2951 RepID=A0A1Q9BY30_SYMMI|nr:hypothetical protein AK812_SmicGene44585 [Symbiodinium microadriaticum]
MSTARPDVQPDVVLAADAVEEFSFLLKVEGEDQTSLSKGEVLFFLITWEDCVIRLYDQDVRASNEAIRTGEVASNLESSFMCSGL